MLRRKLFPLKLYHLHKQHLLYSSNAMGNFNYVICSKCPILREMDYPVSSLFNLIAGGVSGLIAQTTSYPLDIVRRRMQTAGVIGCNSTYRSVMGTIVHVYRKEGIIGGFFKGLSMNWIKGPIAVGVSFATYDFCVDQFRSLL